MPFQRELYKSAFSVDNIIFGFDSNTLKVLLIKRREDPYGGMWALPGDIVSPDENLDDAAIRVLDQLTGVRDVYLNQVYTFGKVDRHPKGRVITIAYYSLINIERVAIRPDSFAEKATAQIALTFLVMNLEHALRRLLAWLYLHCEWLHNASSVSSCRFFENIKTKNARPLTAFALAAQ